jgi:hypothetical protein
MPKVQAQAPKVKARRNWFLITDTQIIDFLSDQTRRRYLRVFMGQTRSISQAAKEINVELHVMGYFVDQLLGFDLIKEVGLKKRQGRDMKLYRAVSDSMMAQLPLLETKHLMMLLSSGDWDWRQELIQGLVSHWHTPDMRWVVRFYSTDQRTWITDAVPETQKDQFLPDLMNDPATPPIWHSNLVLKLEPEAAKRLQSELAELYLRYEALSGQNYDLDAPKYVMQLALAPFAKPEDRLL